MKTDSQYDKILRCLRKGWKSHWDVARETGCYKLSSRAGELVDKGYKIERKKSPDGVFKLYRLVR